MATMKMEALPGQLLSNIAATPYRSTRQAVAGIAEMRKALDTLVFRGVQPQQVEQARYEMVNAIALDVGETVQAEIQERRARMEGVRARYETARKRNRVENRERVETLTRRYSAMSDSEVNAVAMEWIGSENETDPDILDALSAELRGRDPKTWEAFREKMAERRSYEPWTKDGTGALLSAELDQLGACDGNTVPYVGEDGRGVLSLTDIDGFMEVAG